MKRRVFLSTTALTLSNGCLSLLASDCPNPTLEDELSYEKRDATSLFIGEGAVLVTDRDETNRFNSRVFGGAAKQWVKDTELDNKVVLGIQVGTSGESSPLQILGVERKNATTFNAYTCIAHPGQTNDWVPYAKLLRVPHDEQVPTTAILTHWEGGTKQTYP
ncbi:hypothetical protein [Haladaptatus salinisoli]|uniref:hypothetical protein n=1 Tax=Haladaptatus salinisoli TaxID=2884876 RepID=UPI001D0B9BC5|nr:hypothetical protein [Haladaptatus salinisoli]